MKKKSIYLIEKESKNRKGEGERKSEADSALNGEPDMGFNLNP